MSNVTSCNIQWQNNRPVRCVKLKRRVVIDGNVQEQEEFVINFSLFEKPLPLRTLKPMINISHIVNIMFINGVLVASSVFALISMEQKHV